MQSKSKLENISFLGLKQFSHNFNIFVSSGVVCFLSQTTSFMKKNKMKQILQFYAFD